MIFRRRIRGVESETDVRVRGMVIVGMVFVGRRDVVEG